MDNRELSRAVLRHHVIAVAIGVLSGSVSRLIFAQGMTYDKMLSSSVGMLAFLAIGGGIAGLISGWQRLKAIRYYLGLMLLAGGITWVVPLSH